MLKTINTQNIGKSKLVEIEKSKANGVKGEINVNVERSEIINCLSDEDKLVFY